MGVFCSEIVEFLFWEWLIFILGICCRVFVMLRLGKWLIRFVEIILIILLVECCWFRVFFCFFSWLCMMIFFSMVVFRSSFILVFIVLLVGMFILRVFVW